MDLEGLVAATFTPLTVDGRVNLDAIEPYAEYLSGQSLEGVFVNGTTGEGMSLTVEERLQIAARWRDVLPPGLKLIVHVGHNCLADARAMAQHAEAIGADAFSACPPSFFKPQTIEELVACCVEVAAAAPRLPFYYYHIPMLTGVHLQMAAFLPLACEQIPNLRGIKFTDDDLADFAGVLQLSAGKLNVFAGRDEMLLSYLKLGARTAVGSTYNFLAPVLQGMLSAFRRGDLVAAQDIQAFVRDVIAVIVKYGGVSSQKLIMRWIGIDCGPVRLPLVNLPLQVESQLHAELEAHDFFLRIHSG